MNQAELVPVVYIGHKERKEDNIARSGIVWHGHGDVQNVTAQQWGLLSAHPSVWAPAKQVAQAASAAIALGSTAPVPEVATETPKPGPVASDPNVVQSTAAVNGDPNRPQQVLLGSDVLPAHIQIGDELVQLGTVVANAQEASGLTVEDWNGLVPAIREKLLADYVENLRTPAPAGAADTGKSDDGHVDKTDQNGQHDANNAPSVGESNVRKDPNAHAAQPVRRRRAASTPGEVS